MYVDTANARIVINHSAQGFYLNDVCEYKPLVYWFKMFRMANEVFLSRVIAYLNHKFSVANVKHFFNLIIHYVRSTTTNL